MVEERLQKILARAGLASRRACEALITAGRVRVDGRIVTELGVRADPLRSKIEVDDRQVHAEPHVYVVLHKPRGVVCTLSDPEGRPTVAELVRRVPVRLMPVGRLDYQTSGALLMTNDGEFSARLQHPSGRAPKVYVAKVEGVLDDTGLDAWRQSILIDGRATTPAEVRRLRVVDGKTWLEVTLREGRHRQIRRLGEAAGNYVMRLARLSQAGITTEDLRPGEWRYLTRDELVELKKKYGVPRRIVGAVGDRVNARARPPAPASKPARGRVAKGKSQRQANPQRPGAAPPSRPERASAARDASKARPARRKAWRGA